MIKKALELFIRMGEKADAGNKAAQLQGFLSAGDVLKGAETEVHSVTPAAAPPDEPDAEVDDPDPHFARESPLTWYHVDLTLRPQSAEASYEPCGFILTGPDSTSGPAGQDNDSDWGEIYEVQVWNGQAWQDAGTAPLTGQQRLRLHLGVPEGVRKARLRYHFETFGEVSVKC